MVRDEAKLYLVYGLFSSLDYYLANRFSVPFLRMFILFYYSSFKSNANNVKVMELCKHTEASLLFGH